VSTGTYYDVTIQAGDINTIAGDGTPGYAGDGEAATSAELNVPEDIAFDNQGDMLIADYDNNVIRVVVPGTSPASPRLKPTPATGLTSGTKVTVKGSAFPAHDTTLTVSECAPDYATVGLSACDAANHVSVSSGATGGFSVKMTMATGVIAPDGSSCGVPGHTQCELVSIDTSNAAVTSLVDVKFKS